MKTYMPLNGLWWSRNSGSANCDMPQSAVFGRPAGKLYLHFMCYKKTPYYQTNNYWKDGFYQIPKGYDFTKGELIEISTDNIKIIK